MPSRVLIIDDDRSGLFALAEVLERQLDGVVVETALDVNAALDLLREKQYHTVVSDVRMDGLDGLALLNQVRERWPEISVILMTAGGPDRRADAFRQGTFAFLEKPIDAMQFLPTVKSAIERTLMMLRVNDANRQSQVHLSLEVGRMDLAFDPDVKKRPR
jgi:two-component system, NtrC family, response regulator GlrR